MRKTKQGVIYIITNSALPNHLKVGFTEDIAQELKKLNKGNKQGVYSVYATYETNGMVTEKQIMRLIGAENKGNAQFGKGVAQDYVLMSPDEAYKSLNLVARMNGMLAKLKREPDMRVVTINTGVSDSDVMQVRTNKKGATQNKIKTRTRKPNLRFSQYNIPIGSVLEYVKDRSKKVKVVGEHSVEYNGKEMSMSECAKRLLNSKSGVQGTNYFSYNGKTISDIRAEMGI